MPRAARGHRCHGLYKGGVAEVNGTGYATFGDALAAWTEGSTLKLLSDVTMSSTITIPTGEHTLDLNGRSIKAGSTGYSVITIGSGAELTIDDSSENVGKITGGSVGQNNGGGVTVDGGTLTLNGGAISGNANTYGQIGNCGGGDAQIIDNISTWTSDKDGEASINFTTLRLSGDPTIHGYWKTNGTSAPNSHINLDNDGSGIQRIELDGALTNNTGTPNITISPIYRWNDLQNGQTFVFTKNWKTYMGNADPSKYFKSDKNIYPIFLNNNGKVVDSNNNPVKDATVSLTLGGRTVDTILSGSDGGYYFTVHAGLYNIVVKSTDSTVTDMVDTSQTSVYDIAIPNADTDSLLDVVDSDKNIVVGGLNKEAESIRAQEGIASDKNVAVKMTVTPVYSSSTDAAAAIEEFASDRYVECYDFKVEKTVDTQTTYLDSTQNVLEIAIPCSFTSKRELMVYLYDGSGVSTLTESDSKQSGTFRVDAATGMIYLYANRISTYAIGYKPYYSVKSTFSLGDFTGIATVELSKDGETVVTLNDVPLDNVSFSGISKGIYSMTVTWIDGAENTLTLPFTIK